MAQRAVLFDSTALGVSSPIDASVFLAVLGHRGQNLLQALQCVSRRDLPLAQILRR